MASTSASPWLSLKKAAKYLDLTPETLKKRCQRHLKQQRGGICEARLTPGIVARKDGCRWIVQFSHGWWPANDEEAANDY